MRVHWTLLAWTMSSIIAQRISSYMMSVLREPTLYHTLFPLLGAMAGLIYPILFIAVLYLIGRNLNLKGDFRAIVVSLFIGCLMGLVVSDLISLTYGLMFGQFRIGGPPLLLVMTILFGCYNYVITLITHFFMGFGVLAMGFLIGKKTGDRMMPKSRH